MNMPMVTLHVIAMFLGLSGGVMLMVWLYQHTNPKNLLWLIIGLIVLGLLLSYLTFGNMMDFHQQMMGGRLPGGLR